jgi:hypothetical protein
MLNGLKIHEGCKYWYKNGGLHNLEGPAFESHECIEYWINGKLHRINGPAIKYADGGEEWYKDGFRHRDNGPAVDFDNLKDYWYEGERIYCSSTEEFTRIIKLKIFW